MNTRVTMEWPLLRPKNGTLDAGFEELCRQLIAREPEAQDLSWIATGKIDGGVEYYAQFPHGSVWGMQAKWFLTSLEASEWKQVDKSVRTALSARPKLSRYTICFPMNLSDSPKTGRKTAREQWETRKSRYESWARDKGMTTEFVLWDDHALTTRLANPDNRGLLTFWFGGPLFSEDWFRRRSEDAIERAGRRYTPALNVNTPLAKLIDGLTINDRFLNDFETCVKAIRKHQRVLQGEDIVAVAHARALEISDCIQLLVTASRALSADAFALTNWNELGGAAAAASSSIYNILAAIHENSLAERGSDKTNDEKHQYERHELCELAHVLHMASQFCASSSAELAASPALLLVGTAGTGKTHFLCDVVDMLTKDDKPAVLLFGDQFELSNPWKTIAAELELPFSHEELLGSLQSIAEMKRTRALLVVDALNEGVGAKLWRESLPQLIQQVSRFPNVGLVISVRDTFESSVVRRDVASKLVRAVHRGFAYSPLEAQRIYFAGYSIVEPSTPLLLPEFENPLFLKLFCEGLEARGLHEIPRGVEGVSAIFNFYLETINQQISAAIDADPDDKLVIRALNELALALANAPRRALTKADAKAIVEKVAQATSGWQRSLFNQLLSSGALTDMAIGSEIRIRFTYERLADHIVARKILEEARDNFDFIAAAESAIAKITSDDNFWANAGIYEALVVQMPELLGQEAVDLGSETRSRWQSAAFLKSLAWRSPSAVSTRTIELVKEMLNDPSQGSEAVEAVLSCALIIDHPLNADWLSQRLIGMTLPGRDEVWTIPISDGFSDGSSLERLIFWALHGAFGASGTSSNARTTRRLAMIALLWSCTSSSRVLRDRATKAIVALLDHSGEGAAEITSSFWLCNDPYVVQRLLASMAACTMRLNAPSDDLKRLAEAVLRLTKEHGLAVDLLSRDSARSIVLRARALGALEETDDLSLVTPPYGAQPPKHLPSDVRQFQRGDWLKVTQADRDKGGTGLLRVKSSLEHVGDFFRYVIELDVGSTWLAIRRDEPIPQTRREIERELAATFTDVQSKAWEAYDFLSNRSLWKFEYVVVGGKRSIARADVDEAQEQKERRAHRKAVAAAKARLTRLLAPEQRLLLKAFGDAPDRLPQYDNRKAANWIYRRVVELGYANEAFGLYDESVSDREWGREPGALERIGKKYQWIAFFEFEARLADNYRLLDDSFGDSERAIEYVSPHQVVSRDIDATILVNETFQSPYGPHEPAWWSAEMYDAWLSDRSFDEWSHDKRHLPDVKKSLLVTDSDGVEWIALAMHLDWRESAESPVDDDDDYPRRKLWYLIFAYLVPRDKVDDYLGRSGRQQVSSHDTPRDEYRLLWGELFWSPAFEVDAFGMVVEHDENGDLQPSITTAHYLREHGRDKSSDESYVISFPIREIIKGVGAVGSDPERGAWLDVDGEVVAFDPTVTTPGASALLVRRDALEAFLRPSPYALIWTILSEKQAFGGWNAVKATGRFEMTGTYVWREMQDEMLIEGSSDIQFIKWGQEARGRGRKTTRGKPPTKAPSHSTV